MDLPLWEGCCRSAARLQELHPSGKTTLARSLSFGAGRSHVLGRHKAFGGPAVGYIEAVPLLVVWYTRTSKHCDRADALRVQLITGPLGGQGLASWEGSVDDPRESQSWLTTGGSQSSPSPSRIEASISRRSCLSMRAGGLPRRVSSSQARRVSRTSRNASFAV